MTSPLAKDELKERAGRHYARRLFHSPEPKAACKSESPRAEPEAEAREPRPRHTLRSEVDYSSGRSDSD